MWISQAYAQAAGGGGVGDLFGGGLGGFVPLILIFVVFYFLLIRPQQKKMKQHRELIANVRRGDRVVTGGGIIGEVAKVVSDTEVLLEIADGVRVKLVKATITDVITRGEPVKGAKKDDDKSDEDDAKGEGPVAKS